MGTATSGGTPLYRKRPMSCSEERKAEFELLFKAMDTNNSGFLEPEELKKVFGDGWEKVISDCDTNEDGKVSLDVWLQILLDEMPDDDEEYTVGIAQFRQHLADAGLIVPEAEEET